MFYSIFFLLFPICVLYQKNKKTEIIIFNSKTILDIHKDENTLINLKKKYDGFDLSRNQSEKNYDDADTTNNDDDDIDQIKLQKIIIYFRNLKRLNFLQSPFVSEIEKLKCAEEILLENCENENENENENNNFWETFEDVFF
jgi:hypothetical protein